MSLTSHLKDVDTRLLLHPKTSNEAFEDCKSRFHNILYLQQSFSMNQINEVYDINPFMFNTFAFDISSVSFALLSWYSNSNSLTYKPFQCIQFQKYMNGFYPHTFSLACLLSRSFAHSRSHCLTVSLSRCLILSPKSSQKDSVQTCSHSKVRWMYLYPFHMTYQESVLWSSWTNRNGKIRHKYFP